MSERERVGEEEVERVLYDLAFIVQLRHQPAAGSASEDLLIRAYKAIRDLRSALAEASGDVGE